MNGGVFCGCVDMFCFFLDGFLIWLLYVVVSCWSLNLLVVCHHLVG